MFILSFQRLVKLFPYCLFKDLSSFDAERYPKGIGMRHIYKMLHLTTALQFLIQKPEDQIQFTHIISSRMSFSSVLLDSLLHMRNVAAEWT